MSYKLFTDRTCIPENATRKHPYRLAVSCKRSSVNQMAAGLRLQVQGIFSSFTYCSNMLCAVKFKGFRPHGVLVYRLCLPPIIFINFN